MYILVTFFIGKIWSLLLENNSRAVLHQKYLGAVFTI